MLTDIQYALRQLNSIPDCIKSRMNLLEAADCVQRAIDALERLEEKAKQQQSPHCPECCSTMKKLEVIFSEDGHKESFTC